MAVFPLSRSRPGVDRLVAPLGIDESLAFIAFDKTIIFGHFLSKPPLLVHARPYPIPMGLQPCKGAHAYTNCVKIKFVASN